MSTSVISIQNISKTYILNNDPYGLLSSRISKWLNPLQWGNPQPRKLSPFYALKDVSFDVQEGDILGLIGRNGTGKSTLLKIISQITRPSAGRIKIRGKVGSLLEVGTGFHPELTGRENIFLNGAIIGMSKADIKKAFGEIVEFAGTGPFVDTQLKYYSSGMQTRLAFSIAAHLNAKTLLLDEVLSVGDAAYQEKCAIKIEELGQGGKTIILVSHNLGTIKRMCNCAVLLQAGEVVKTGAPEEVIGVYQRDYVETFKDAFHSKKGDFKVTDSFINPEIKGECASLEAASFNIVVESAKRYEDIIVSIGIENEWGERASLLTNVITHEPITLHPGRNVLRCHCPSLPLVPGKYRLSIKITTQCQDQVWMPNSVQIQVHMNPRFLGISGLDRNWLGNMTAEQKWSSQS